MSNINLLPWREAAKEKQKNNFYLLLGGTCLVAAAGVFAVNQYFNFLTNSQNQRNQFLQNEIAVLNVQLGEIREIKAKKAALVSRMNLIDQLQSSRNTSVKLFNQLPDVISNGVYLSSLNLNQDNIDVVGKAEAYNRVANTMRQIDKTSWLGQTSISSIFTSNTQNMSLSEFSLHFNVLNGKKTTK